MLKNHFRCVGRGWRGKDCVATERVEISTKPYTCVLEGVWFVEAAEWVSMVFERPETINKVHKVLKEYYVKF